MTGSDNPLHLGARMEPSSTGLLASYPRQRPPLSPAHEQIFATEYRLNRDGNAMVEGLAKKVEGWMHRRVAVRETPGNTLELGAGTLNHLKFEHNIHDYDIVEPFTELFIHNPLRRMIRNVFNSQSEIPLVPTYSRIISVAVLEHMTDLPVELARSGKLLTDDGLFQAGIPSEGGLLWWLGWRCTTGLSYWMRNHLDYGVIMRHEHVNNANEILDLCKYFFSDVRIQRFPPSASNNFSLYIYIEAARPIATRCEQFLHQRYGSS